MALLLQLWETLKEEITVYTGLSPATFVTSLALLWAFYYVATSLFGSSDDRHHQRSRAFEEQMEPLPPPVQLGEITQDELKQYDGSDSKKPLLMAIKGQIYDVSQSRMDDEEDEIVVNDQDVHSLVIVTQVGQLRMNSF